MTPVQHLKDRQLSLPNSISFKATEHRVTHQTKAISCLFQWILCNILSFVNCRNYKTKTCFAYFFSANRARLIVHHKK